MNLDTVLGSTRAETLVPMITSCLREAYAENAARFSEELGDNNMTFATCVIHNLRHLLEEALADEEGIRIERPDGTFQVIAGRAILHFYKGRLGTAEAIEIRFDQSRTKRALVRRNADQLQMHFDIDVDELAVIQSAPTNLVFVHAGDHVEGLRAVWVGAPVMSGVNGFQWLWHEQLYGQHDLSMSEQSSQVPEMPWVDEVELPELIIGLRERSQAEEDAAEAS